jgi:hypothetical protein
MERKERASEQTFREESFFFNESTRYEVRSRPSGVAKLERSRTGPDGLGPKRPHANRQDPAPSRRPTIGKAGKRREKLSDYEIENGAET